MRGGSSGVDGYRYDTRTVRESGPHLTFDDRRLLTREGQVLRLRGCGLTFRQIAHEVGCSFGTVQKIVKADSTTTS